MCYMCEHACAYMLELSNTTVFVIYHDTKKLSILQYLAS